jgi:hypothetical protein
VTARPTTASINQRRCPTQLTHQRLDAGTTLLNTGTVLVARGENETKNGCTALTSAELSTP